LKGASQFDGLPAAQVALQATKRDHWFSSVLIITIYSTSRLHFSGVSPELHWHDWHPNLHHTVTE